MGEFNSEEHYIYYCGQKSLRRNGVAIIVNKRVRNALLGCNLKSNMETYITVCKIDSQQEFAVWLRKLKQGLCINLGGVMGRELGGIFTREGVYVYLWLIHVEV